MRDGWGTMRGECEGLAHSLQKYALMLEEKNKFMKVVNSSPALWRSVTNRLDLYYVKATKKLAPELVEIRSLLQG